MWIALNVCILVMFAVYCYPLFGSHTGGHPQPKSHKVAQHRMKLNTSMCLISV
jgi:hypothetical protein